MSLPAKDSPAWPWIRMVTRQAAIFAAFGLYYTTGLALPDFKTMVTVLLLDVGMEKLKEVYNK